MEKLKKKNCVLKHDESFLIKIVNIQGYLHVQNKIYDWAGLFHMRAHFNLFSTRLGWSVCIF